MNIFAVTTEEQTATVGFLTLFTVRVILVKDVWYETRS